MASAVQFSTLRDLGRKELTHFLDKYSGTKVLIWDEKLTGPMDQIARFSFLKQRRVERMFRVDQRLSAHDLEGIDNVVYVTRPDVAAMEAVANSVKNIENVRSQNRAEFHALFVPNRSLLCDKRLQDLGVYGSFTFIDELGTFWFPLEADLISMEAPSIFADFHLDSDPTALYGVARGVMAIQSIYGVIPRVYGKGKAAQHVFNYMQSMRKELLGQEPEIVPQIDTAIILDRQIDLISPLITQLTYEGLIDEMFGVQNSSVSLPADRFMEGAATAAGSGAQDEDEEQSPADQPGGAGRKTIHLTSNEEMYAEIRDKNFNAVGPYLSRKAKSLSAQDEKRKNANTVRELKTFVDSLPQMMAMKQSLATHTSVAEQVKEETERRQFLEFLQAEQELLNFQNTDRIVDRVEEAACEDEDLVRVLRVACLQSVVNSGLKPKILESYRRTVAHSYGYKHVMSLYNLDKVGLLSTQLSTRNYAVLRKRLNLTLDDVNEQDPTDTAYVHSVYAPITIRLIENFSKPGGWRGIRDVLDLLPGPTIEETQPLASNLRRRNDGNEEDRPKVTLVVFVGGCTFAEISALRFLSQQEDSNTEYLIATTAIINGNTFLRSLLTDISDPMEY